MKKFKSIGIFILIVSILLVAKFYFSQPKDEKSIKGGNASKMPVKVSIQVLKSEVVSPEYHVSGTLVANEQVQLLSETQGLVTKVLFKEGTQVLKGQLLLKINDADYQAQLKKAVATKKLKAENANRNETLLKKEAIAQADYDLAVTELNSIDADIEFLKEQIRKTEIRAPFSGVVGLRNISEGSYLTQNTPIATIEDESQLKLDFSVPEKYALMVKTGDEISFSVSGSDQVYKAKIYARDASVSTQTRSIRMRALCDNRGLKLMPGLFANITLKLSTDKSSFMIPTQSLVPVLKGQKVFVVQGDSAVEHMVKTGFRNENKVEVIEGLETGDSLIVDGIMYMKPGLKVKVVRN